LCGRSNTQRPNESLNEHVKRFPQQVEVVEAVLGKLVPACHDNDNAKNKESACKQRLASSFLAPLGDFLRKRKSRNFLSSSEK